MDYKKIKEACEAATDQYLDRRSMLFIEAAIGCLLDTRSAKEAAEILREFADQLEEFG